MEAALYIIPGQFAYLAIPSARLRRFVDGLFPGLAKFPIADTQAGGPEHRYWGGHDLLLDVPATIKKYGVTTGFKHAGHIVLTDFPTKAGIPIPGFSRSGLGQLLETVGISRGWLSVNICDVGVGVLAVAEGASDLAQVLDGVLVMDMSTFFDTFVEGGVEVALAVSMENPILLAGGIQNILAGIASTWNTISVYVDPSIFLGALSASGMIGFAIGYGIAGQSLPEAALSALRCGVVGALFSVSAAFGFSAIGGFLAFAAGRALARHHRKSVSMLFSADRHSAQLFREEVLRGSPNIQEFLQPTDNNLLDTDVPLLDTDVPLLDTDVPLLDTGDSPVQADQCGTFATDAGNRE